MLDNLNEAQSYTWHPLSAARQLKDLVLFCPKPYFRLVNNSKQHHKHKVHEKLIKLHIRHTPNGVTVKKIQAKQVMHTCCKKGVNLYAKVQQHDIAIHGMKVDMMLNNMQLESLKSDKRLRSNRHLKLQQNNSFSNSNTITSGSPLWSKI